MTRRATTGDDWSNPENLGPGVNRSEWDFSPRISPNGLVLCFRSDRSPGGYLGGDIWVTRRQSISDPWRPPVYVGPTDERPVGERGEGDVGLSFSADDSTLYFCSDDLPGGFGRYDLWQVDVIPIVDFNGDGKVDGFEFTKLVDHWGQDEPSCDIGPTPLGDGIVDVQDLIVLSECLFHDVRLRAHWELDEVEGTIAHDSADKHNGLLHGEPTWQPTAGQVAGALAFDGVDDHV